ncbi:MAG: hypothetical protein GVY04_16970, partial [Cyanobacteria bacterium]|nr:hypothetical protein [Cyanobacteria bacterium GSL.Bin1]
MATATSFVINPGGNLITGSTFTKGSFQITNNSTTGELISKITIDLTTALFQDLVFDPFKVAGDSGGRDVTIESDANSVYSSHQYFSERDGGYDILELSFNDFGFGEFFSFAVDTDPTSIKWTTAPGPGDSGSISGLELVGATVTVEYSDGTAEIGQVYRIPESDTASQVVITSISPDSSLTPTLEVLGISSAAATVSDPNQTVRIYGPAGASASLLIVEAALYIEGDGYDIDPYEGNTAIAVDEKFATIGSEGYVDIPVVLTHSDPAGGLNHLVATLTDGEGNTSAVTSRTVLELQASNIAPTTSGIADVAVSEGAVNTNIALFDAFEDAESTDAELNYAITDNTNAALFDTVTIDAATGSLTLDYAATGTGTSDITVSATDPEGLSTQSTFTVTVNEASVVNSQQVEAEAYVAFVDSSAGNDGDTTQFTDDVDVYVTDDATGEFHIGKIANGESLTYSVDIATAAVYDLVLRVDNNRSSDREVTVTAGGQAYNFAFGSTNGWDDVVLPDISLGAGTQSI